MQVRFGYVAIALNIPEGSPNKTVTVKNLEKIVDTVAQTNRLRRLLKENLTNTLRILRYNVAHNIRIYRLTSKIVPLATHPIAANWDYIDEFRKEWRQIGDYIKAHNLRISAHPDHYTLLNSPHAEVTTAALRDLEYHTLVFEALGLDLGPQLVIHIGGVYNNKAAALERFMQECHSLPERIKMRLMLENDDKNYDAADVLKVCQTLKRPMVLDIHHHACLKSGCELTDLWSQIVAGWHHLCPKIHLSSPKDAKNFRSHADYINPMDFIPFIKMAKEFDRDFDVMIEAKQKDKALFKLLDDLESIKGIRRIDDATIEI